MPKDKPTHYHDKTVRQESRKLEKLFNEYAKFYEMPPHVDLHDITDIVLKSPLVKKIQKKHIQNTHRRILVFVYPSDGLKIKGLISYCPDFQNQPLLVFLRGGNRLFGTPNPGSDFFCPGHYTVIASMYRDGVSEGTDEFGGNDVNDVKNLVDFIPTLEKKLDLDLQKNKLFLLGASRGGMQMFLALARFPELQKSFSKIVSLSGLLDMRDSLAHRPDLEEMFTNDYGYKKGVNADTWINQRDPLLSVKYINQTLPILIIQGTNDNRISLEAGYHMVDKLQTAGNQVTYWEIKDGKHCLTNRPDRLKLILTWLEENVDSAKK